MGTAGRLPRQAGNPHPGQGCCEAGKRQVRGHHRIVVIRRTGTTQDGTGPRRRMALLADILDVLHGASPAARQRSRLPPAEELSPGELRVLRYLPTNLSRPEIAGELTPVGRTRVARQ